MSSHSDRHRRATPSAANGSQSRSPGHRTSETPAARSSRHVPKPPLTPSLAEPSRDTPPSPESVLQPTEPERLGSNGIPPIVGSQFNLPIRFRELWGDQLSLDVAAHASGYRPWPVELWEAFFAVLYERVTKRDPQWAQAFRTAVLRHVVRPSLSESALKVDDFLGRLQRLMVDEPDGRPKGSRAGGPKEWVWWLRREFFAVLKPAWSRRHGYVPGVPEKLKETWALAQAFIKDGFRHPEFPFDFVRNELNASATPAALAEAIVARATGLADATVHAYYQDGQRDFAPRLTLLPAMQERPRPARG